MTASSSARIAWTGLLLAGAIVLLADALTTYAALTSPTHRYAEATPAVSSAIATIGLGAALAMTVATRLAAFVLAAIVARRYRRLGVALYLVVLIGVAYTGLLAVGNLEELAR